MANSHPRQLTDICLPVWVYDAIVPVAFAKNTSIREVTERLFRGSLRHLNENLADMPDFSFITQGILMSPQEKKRLEVFLPYPCADLIPMAAGFMIGREMEETYTPEHGHMQWVAFELAYLRPIF